MSSAGRMSSFGAVVASFKARASRDSARDGAAGRTPGRGRDGGALAGKETVGAAPRASATPRIPLSPRAMEGEDVAIETVGKPEVCLPLLLWNNYCIPEGSVLPEGSMEGKKNPFRIVWPTDDEAHGSLKGGTALLEYATLAARGPKPSRGPGSSPSTLAWMVRRRHTSGAGWGRPETVVRFEPMELGSVCCFTVWRLDTAMFPWHARPAMWQGQDGWSEEAMVMIGAVPIRALVFRT